jgi:hypothetical protein
LRIYLFLTLKKKNPTPFPLREVPLRGGEMEFVMPLLPALRSEILKRSCDPLLQDPFGVSEQVD